MSTDHTIDGVVAGHIAAGVTAGGRATVRPAHVAAPAHWKKDAGPPAPEQVEFKGQAIDGRPDPVRYGDWEHKGIAIDF
jgi:hypothetical protein